MKQCPACKTTYTDDSLKFCLADGTALGSATDEQPTVVKTAGNKPIRVDIPSAAAETTTAMPAVDPAPARSSGTWIKIALGVVVLAMLAIGAIGLIGAAFYYGFGGKEKETAIKNPTPTPTATATPDAENERLKDEVANIQKSLDEQKKTSINTRPPRPPDQPQTMTATANSPEDGFLALRSQPNAETGARITKIPHGAQILIGTCGQYLTTRRNNYGRWCTASYNGYTGWVFDAFVKY